MNGKIINARTLAMTGVAGLAAGVISLGFGAGSAAMADPTPGQRPAGTTPTVSTGMLLQSDDFVDSGLAMDTAAVDTLGRLPIGDAGRFDEGCLGEKSIRNLAGDKNEGTPTQAKGYAEATWTSSTDKEAWVREELVQAKNTTVADRVVASLTSEINSVKSCETDPAGGDSYGPAHKLAVDGGTVTYYLDRSAAGTTDGGGTAIVRTGTTVAVVDLMSGREGKADSTIKRIAQNALSRIANQ